MQKTDTIWMIEDRHGYILSMPYITKQAADEWAAYRPGDDPDEYRVVEFVRRQRTNPKGETDMVKETEEYYNVVERDVCLKFGHDIRVLATGVYGSEALCIKCGKSLFNIRLK